MSSQLTSLHTSLHTVHGPAHRRTLGTVRTNMGLPILQVTKQLPYLSSRTLTCSCFSQSDDFIARIVCDMYSERTFSTTPPLLAVVYVFFHNEHLLSSVICHLVCKHDRATKTHLKVNKNACS